MHIADCIQVNKRSDSSNEERHCDAQRICQERHIDMQRTDWQPREQCDDMVTFFSSARQEIEVHPNHDKE